MTTKPEMLKKIWGSYDKLPLFIDILFVAAVVVFVCFYNLNWAEINQKPPFSDASTHAYQSLLFHKTVTEVPSVGQSIFQFLAFRNHYPPFNYQMGEFGYLVMGTSKLAPVVGMFPFVAIMGFSMYFLGRHLGGRLGGMCAAVICCTSPVVLEYSRLPFIDFQLASVVALGLCTLICSQSFADSKISIACGAAFALGMLTKWTYPLFIAIPLAISLISALCHSPKCGYISACKSLLCVIALEVGQYFLFSHDIKSPPDHGPGWAYLGIWAALLALILGVRHWMQGKRPHTPVDNIVLALLTMIAVTGPWYNHNVDKILHKVTYQANVSVKYAEVITNNLIVQNTWVYGALILVGVGFLVSLFRRQVRWIAVELLLNWALVMAVLSYAPFDPRYIMPLLVLSTCIGVCAFPCIGILGLIPLALYTYVGLTQACYHTLQSPPHWYTMIAIREVRPPIILPDTPSYPQLPFQSSYPYEEFLSNLSVTYEKDSQSWVCLFLATSPSEANVIQPRSFLYYGMLNNQLLDVVSPLTDEHYHDLGTTELSTANFALMYRDPGSILLVPERFYDPNQPQTREDLIQVMREISPYFPAKFTTKKIYRFGQDTILELLDTEEVEE